MFLFDWALNLMLIKKNTYTYFISILNLKVVKPSVSSAKCNYFLCILQLCAGLGITLIMLNDCYKCLFRYEKELKIHLMKYHGIKKISENHVFLINIIITKFPKTETNILDYIRIRKQLSCLSIRAIQIQIQNKVLWLCPSNRSWTESIGKIMNLEFPFCYWSIVFSIATGAWRM